MANLELIRSLNTRYAKDSPIVEVGKELPINEAFDPSKIEKALKDSLAAMGPLYTGYFDFGLPADVAMLFIDVCSFSTRCGNMDGEEIAKYFDLYYDIVIPIIYKYGGEVDKIIGDGIICIFGRPFLNCEIEDAIKAANLCAKEIIRSTMGTPYSSKIAFHSGKIHYFKNKSEHYKEFTVIGKPLTELFRLESVSLDEAINYYSGTGIRKYYQSISSHYKASNGSPKYSWKHEYLPLPSLKGVSYTGYHTIEYKK